MLAAVLTATLIMSGIALAAGLLLGFASRRLPGTTESLVDRVNDLLPQTQCAQCGYAGCRPYAAAIANEGAPINLCPPGGAATIERLAELLHREPAPLVEPAAAPPGSVAVIDESACIGCTWCREACPVDAIVGTHHYLHTIIARECTGCALCVPRCPVDCIRMTA